MLLLGKVKIDGVPCSPFNAGNTTDITDTTPVAIKAAVVGKRHWVSRISLVNKTAAETPIVKIQDDTGTPVVLLATRLGGLADPSSAKEFTFNPPIEVASGKAINGLATTATGDVIATIGGWVED